MISMSYPCTFVLRAINCPLILPNIAGSFLKRSISSLAVFSLDLNFSTMWSGCLKRWHDDEIDHRRPSLRDQSPESLNTCRHGMKRVSSGAVSFIVETCDTWMMCSSIHQSLLPDSNSMNSSSLKFQLLIPSFLYYKWALIVALYYFKTTGGYVEFQRLRLHNLRIRIHISPFYKIR